MFSDTDGKVICNSVGKFGVGHGEAAGCWLRKGACRSPATCACYRRWGCRHGLCITFLPLVQGSHIMNDTSDFIAVKSCHHALDFKLFLPPFDAPSLPPLLMFPLFSSLLLLGSFFVC